MLRTAILITLGLLIIGIASGCSDNLPEEVTDSPQLENDVPPSPTIKIVIDPASGGYILPNTKFTLTFNEEVVTVTVNDTPASGSGLNWKWSAQPYLPSGSVTLKIMWTNRNGSRAFAKAGPYKVADGHPAPPVITSGTVSDGDVGVDPAVMNAGGFRFDFDAPVIGDIRLTDEAGADLNWISNVAGQTATLTAIAGQELVNETTYKIEIDVQDGVGLGFRTTITFVTKPK